MLGKKQKRVRHPRRKVLDVIAEAFREIEACYELLGFSANQDEELPPDEQQPNNEGEQDAKDADYPDYLDHENDTEQDYDTEPEGGPTVYQREEIEVAVDVFISELVHQKLIPKPPADSKGPSLAEVFQGFFGEDHKIVELAKEFEDHIEGYFGAIGFDEMSSAYGNVLAIRDILNKEMQLHAAH